MIDRKLLKNSLSIDDISEIVQRLGAPPPIKTYNALIFETVCHNHPEEGSKKLYYYPDTRLFRCYTGCGEIFDIFGLIIKSFATRGISMNLSQALYWTHRNTEIFFSETPQNGNSEEVEENLKRDIKIYDDGIVDYLPFRIVYDWYNEGISIETMKRYNIKHNPVTSSIIIPHYNIDGKLIGLRQRTLVQDEEFLGKYRPATINGKTYPHPLSFNLYGINFNKENITSKKQAIVFEGEKSVLMLDKVPDSCAVACCGSSLSFFQIDMLVSLGVEEIVIAFDKEFVELGDDGYKKQVRNLTSIYNKFKDKVIVSFIFDIYNRLEYKDSPIDKGLSNFNWLFNNRFTLE